MVDLPSEIIYDVFSRIPIKTLFRFRSACKLWRDYIDDPYLAINHAKQTPDEPIPIMFIYHPKLPRILRFLHINESKEGNNSLESKKNLVMEFWCNESLSRHSWIAVHGSCNGLLYLSHDHLHGTALVVIHPLRKECYELPPINIALHKDSRESCGLGFDASTNTFKMVCVLLRKEIWSENLDKVRKNLRTMVHVLGTDSWREIPQVPSYPINGEPVFSHGYLYWVSANLFPWPTGDRRKVICYDVRKEEFGLIDPPKETSRSRTCPTDTRLVDLHGEVGYVVHRIGQSMEVWVLKLKEWVIYCRFDQKPPCPRGEMSVLGHWNKNGDILLTNTRGSETRLFVYSRESGVIREIDLVGGEDERGEYIRMYQSGLFTIHGNNAN
ncbi:hypothetical protein L2E82_34818 [Cichorium intybus]|uniref:Uncharacterized protein n=1 Tax=Cichorium intybus TaxID=13427 RepID=A0ACB9BMU1_CICIN|nr:hypothetical protein L2E82_34818 [Cichorium intybus]